MVITLIGYRGSGKSSVGRQLAARLNWDFVDADVEIERRANLTIAQMFAQHGEPYFRNLEAHTIADLLQRPNLVLATGGGAILDARTRAALQVAGPVIWLQASIPVLLNRIEGDATTGDRRPALTNAVDRRSEIEQVLNFRWPLYQEAATHIIQTDGRAIPGIVDDIVSQLPASLDKVW